MATEKWDIDTVHSSVGFTVRHMVIAKVHGQFPEWTADLLLDTSDLTKSKVDVKIAVSSINTHDAQRDGHLKSADFFDVEKYPSIEFKSSRVEQVKGEHYRVIGALKMHGAEREVVLETEFGGQAKDPWGNQRVGFTAKAKIDRKDFGLEWNKALETGGVLVGETIDITIEVEAKKG